MLPKLIITNPIIYIFRRRRIEIDSSDRFWDWDWDEDFWRVKVVDQLIQWLSSASLKTLELKIDLDSDQLTRFTFTILSKYNINTYKYSSISKSQNLRLCLLEVNIVAAFHVKHINIEV